MVVFAEMSRSVAKLIQKNAETLGVNERVKVLAEPIPSVISRLKSLGPFDLVMADPPYGENWEGILLATWPWGELLSPQGHFCVEWGVSKSSSEAVLPEKTDLLEKIREKKYGDSVLTTYLRC